MFPWKIRPALTSPLLPPIELHVGIFGELHGESVLSLGPLGLLPFPILVGVHGLADHELIPTRLMPRHGAPRLVAAQ